MGLPAQSGARVGALGVGVTLVALLATGGAATAAPKAITGKLNMAGYTVIALDVNGRAKVVRASRGRFKLRPPARTVTLQLRAPNGVYAGPVVIGRKKRGRLAILGVRAGARLGRIKVRRGHARVSKRVRKRWVDANRRARAKKGIPVGAGRFGRVRSRTRRASAPGDLDLDGIPDLLDVDDDGDLILDNLDRSSARHSALIAQGDVIEAFGLHTNLSLTVAQTANANAAQPGSPLTLQQIDTALSRNSFLNLDVMPGDSLANSPELDCGGAIQRPPRPLGLVYCRPHASGGIGKVVGARFPDDFDPDGDGLGTLRPSGPPPPMGRAGMGLNHGSTTAQIGTGDVLIQRVTRGGQEISFLATLQYVLATVPALASYRDTTMAAPAKVPYPFPAGPGHDLSLSAPPGQDVVVELTFWRPQRRALSAWGEPGDWIDIGGLDYAVGPSYSAKSCPQSALSETDPNLAPIPIIPARPGAVGFRDLATDRPANPANTFTYTLNVTRCLASTGASLDPSGLSFLALNPSGVDNAQQFVPFKLE